ncbi:hypothetical protein E2C01_078606 [Portunus trituberculatus]|uniref:Uncharacterized protein n=1 Tax=Portunus trituberculatus TaxID=210409 RepID=A0A5B7IN90_PORTR|nr:hypothetical protein [Portunus trituberculatus]
MKVYIHGGFFSSHQRVWPSHNTREGTGDHSTPGAGDTDGSRLVSRVTAFASVMLQATGGKRRMLPVTERNVKYEPLLSDPHTRHKTSITVRVVKVVCCACSSCPVCRPPGRDDEGANISSS